jgi:hypothetical protein
MDRVGTTTGKRLGNKLGRGGLIVRIASRGPDGRHRSVKAQVTIERYSVDRNNDRLIY